MHSVLPVEGASTSFVASSAASCRPTSAKAKLMTPPASASLGSAAMRQLPENLLLHTFGFLDVPTLVALLATDRHWRTLAAARSLWKPACCKEWPAMMEQLGYCLDAQPDAYRCFFFKNRRSAYEARFERAIGGRPGATTATTSRDTVADEAAAARVAAVARARQQYLAHFFQELLLFVDLRHAVSDKPLHSMAIPLTLPNVRKLFKADMRESAHYDNTNVDETFLVHQGMDDLELGEEDAKALAAAVEGAGGAGGVRFDLTLFHKKSKTMALLGQGQADLDQRVAGYGPRFGIAGEGQEDKKECRFFGEGAEFLCAVPLFAWVFASTSNDHRRMALHALAIEVHYVDSADTSVRPEDELLECLHQIFRKELVWV